jgi:nucleoid-associated protein YgaU
MRKTTAITLIVSFALVFSACSSSKKTAGEAGTDEFPVADAAGTDAVPLDGAEQTPPPTDSSDPAAIPPADSTSVAGSGQFEDYTVQEGDTLMKIAFETYGDLYQWRRIYEGNRDRIQDPNAVPKGTVIKVEKPASAVAIDRNGEKYLIKPGDTLGRISNDVYGTQSKWRKLWENNRQLIRDPNKIFAGFYLYYVITPEEQQQKETNPAPLAGSGTDAPPAPADSGLSPVDPGSAAAAPADTGRDPASAKKK